MCWTRPYSVEVVAVLRLGLAIGNLVISIYPSHALDSLATATQHSVAPAGRLQHTAAASLLDGRATCWRSQLGGSISDGGEAVAAVLPSLLCGPRLPSLRHGARELILHNTTPSDHQPSRSRRRERAGTRRRMMMEVLRRD